jgi:hypothetical protein
MCQPKWKFIANLGDVDPIEHGGYFVKIDTTGVYQPEVEVLIAPNEEEGEVWEVYRFILEACTFENGILSDNKFHPECSVWFATPESKMAERPQDTTYLSRLCSSQDVKQDELTEQFCSDDPLERAWAWRNVGEYHGWYELDQEPLKLNRREVFGRFNSRINMLNRQAKKARTTSEAFLHRM